VNINRLGRILINSKGVGEKKLHGKHKKICHKRSTMEKPIKIVLVSM